MDHSQSAYSDPSELEPWAQELARQSVRFYLATTANAKGFADYDRADLEQEVLAHWLQQRHGYRPERGASPQTFFRRMAENVLHSLHRRAMAGRRGGGTLARSLEQIVVEGGEPLGATIEDTATVSPQRAAEKADLGRVLHAFLATLTVRQRALLLHLASEMDMTAIARELAVDRSTLYRDLKQIRRAANRDQELMRELRDATDPDRLA